ncbi:MAG: hypothetical protein G8D58_09830, partial [gamma proteobacterium symbiont of Phacoides pectinatus]
QVHFGDRPRAESAEQVRLPRQSGGGDEAGPGSGPSQAERLELQQRMLDAYRKERRETRRAAARDKRERQRRCLQGRAQLEDYIGAQIYDLDEDGNRRFYSDEEREALLERYRKVVERECGPG